MERCGRLLCTRNPGSSWSVPSGSAAAPELASAAGLAGGLLGRAPQGPGGPLVRAGGSLHRDHLQVQTGIVIAAQMPHP